MTKKLVAIMGVICLILVIISANLILKYKENENKKDKNILENFQTSGEVIKITKDTFENEVLKSNKVVLIDFFANWCEPCKKLSPIISEIAKENEKLKVVKIDIDEENELATQYGIVSIPTLILIENGEEKDRIIGYVGKDTILEMIKDD